MERTRTTMKTCDQCKARKVRCVGAGEWPFTQRNFSILQRAEASETTTEGPNKLAAHQGATSCVNCARRSAVCHFSPRRPRKRAHQDLEATPAPSPDSSNQRHNHIRQSEPDNGISGMPPYDGLQELYVDRLLSGPSQNAPRNSQKVPLQVRVQGKPTRYYLLIPLPGSRCLRYVVGSEKFYLSYP